MTLDAEEEKISSDSSEIAGLTVFILVLFMGIFSIVFGIPGTAVILIDVILYALITGFEKSTVSRSS